MARLVSYICIAVFPAGWLVPLALGVDCYLSFVGLDLPQVSRGLAPYNSFPMMNSARLCFRMAFIWLALVIAFWTYRKLKHERSS